MIPSVKLEAEYPHQPEQVWRALTDPQAIAKWLMQNDFAPQVGHRFQFRKPPGYQGFVDCEVLECDPPRRLVYTWDEGEDLTTTVSFDLEAVPGGTRLRFEHAGFSGESGQRLRNAVSGGWPQMITKGLPAVVAALAMAE